MEKSRRSSTAFSDSIVERKGERFRERRHFLFPLGVPVDFWGAVPANSLELTLSSGGLADFGTPVPTIAPAKTRAAIIDTIVRLSTMIT